MFKIYGVVLSVLFSIGAWADPVTNLHYASGLSSSTLGFNLADVSDVGSLNALPSGMKGLVWLGMCNGVDTNFINAVTPFIGNPKLLGFYIWDEPDPTGLWATLCPAKNLKAESDYIHAHVPNAITFVVLMQLGSNAAPSYSYNGLYYGPDNTDLDYFGIDYYPCLSEYGTSACQNNLIKSAVQAAEAVGIPTSKMIPVYQTYGCNSANAASGCGDDNNGYAFVPTATQLQQMLTTWGSVLPTPLFDYAYTWNVSDIQYPLSVLPALQTVMAAHNANAAPSPSPTPAPTPTPTPSPSPTPSGTNLVANGGFENGLKSWNVWAYARVVASPVNSGAAALRVGRGDGGVYQDITSKLQVGKTYTLSFAAKLGSSTGYSEIGIEFLDAGGNVISDSHAVPTTTSYAQKSFNFNYPSGVTSALIYVYVPAQSSYVFVDDFSVVGD